VDAHELLHPAQLLALFPPTCSWIHTSNGAARHGSGRVGSISGPTMDVFDECCSIVDWAPESNSGLSAAAQPSAGLPCEPRQPSARPELLTYEESEVLLQQQDVDGRQRPDGESILWPSPFMRLCLGGCVSLKSLQTIPTWMIVVMEPSVFAEQAR
jgi:hypothetical protein